jgi:hypothetical protein
MRQRRNLEAGRGGVCAADLMGGQQRRAETVAQRA